MGKGLKISGSLYLMIPGYLCYYILQINESNCALNVIIKMFGEWVYFS